MAKWLKDVNSFNYLRSVPPSLPKVALYVAAISLTALGAIAGWSIRSTRSHPDVSAPQQHRPSLRGSAATSRAGPNAKVHPERLITGAMNHRRKQRPPTYTAAAKSAALRPFSTDVSRRRACNVPAQSQRAIPSTVKLAERVRVLAIVTGGRSSALVLLRGKSEVVSAGDFIGGLRVAEIRESGVLLTNHQRLTLPVLHK